jgi:hypothetical protein
MYMDHLVQCLLDWLLTRHDEFVWVGVNIWHVDGMLLMPFYFGAHIRVT